MPVVYISLPNEVTSRSTVTASGLVFNRATQLFSGTVRVTNTGATAQTGPMYVQLNGLPSGVTVNNAAGTNNGAPYIVSGATTLAPGGFVDIPVQFRNPSVVAISYTSLVFAGAI